MERRAKTATIIFAVLVILGLAVLVYLRGPSGIIPSVEPKREFAPAGELAPGFPGELILDGKENIESSFSVNYGPGVSQYTANFSTDGSLRATADKYKSYLEKNGWIITNEISQHENSRGLYAKKQNFEVSVAILDQRERRGINLTYIIAEE